MSNLSTPEALSSSEARRRRRVRRSAATYEIRRCESWTRRLRLERDVFKWLQWYGGGASFRYEFTPNQRAIITAILTATTTGGAIAIAASRGDGKSTITEWVIKYLILTGKARLIIYLAGTEDLSKKFIHNIQQRFLRNERLAADYPEVCGPVRDVAGNGSRAKFYVAYGASVGKQGEPFEPDAYPFEWSTHEFTCPEIPGSKAGGAKVLSGSVTGSVRGVKDVDQRPDVVVLDDIDRDTRLTEETAAELERIIDSGLGFLGGQQEGLGRVLLTTVQGHFTVSAKFTDRKQKPAWHGRRFKFLESPPTDMEKWAQFIEMQELDWQKETSHAHEFYLANRASMDEGAVVGNPNRFFANQGEVSALEHYFRQVAEKGWEAVRREYDNQPPIDEIPVDDGLTAHAIMRRLSGVPRKIVPGNCKKVTRGIDINRNMAHYVVRAWAEDGTGYVIDYDIEETKQEIGTDEGLEENLQKCLLRIIERSEDEPYTYEDGSAVPVSATFMDSRWMTGAIRQAAKTACEAWGTRFYTIMGCGKSGRCKSTSYREVLRTVNPDRKIREGFHLDRVPGVCWEAKCDKERFVLYEHSRWAAPNPAGLWLYGEKILDPNAVRLSPQERVHQSYGKHIVNEKQVEVMVKGIKKVEWKATNMVHYLDASCYATVGAIEVGIVLPGFNKKTPPAPIVMKERPTRESLQRLW